MTRAARLLGGSALFGTIAFFFYQCTEVALPPLARGLGTYGDRGEFSARVKAKYKPGMREDELIEDLRTQGFKLKYRNEPMVVPGGRRKLWSVAEIDRFVACGGKSFSVRWFSEQGVMTEIYGVYGATCL